MKPREHYFAIIGGYAAVSLFFLVLGICFVIISLGENYSLEVIVVGAMCIGLGSHMMWWTYQQANPPKAAPKPPDPCPYCGALNEPNTTICQKCQRPLTNLKTYVE